MPDTYRRTIEQAHRGRCRAAVTVDVTGDADHAAAVHRELTGRIERAMNEAHGAEPAEPGAVVRNPGETQTLAVRDGAKGFRPPADVACGDVKADGVRVYPEADFSELGQPDPRE